MKLLDAMEIVRMPAASGATPFQVQLACGFNPLHLDLLLKAELRLAIPDRRIELGSGLYGDFWGNIDRLAEAEKNGLDAAVLLIEWPDIDPRFGIRTSGAWTPAALAEIVAQTSVFGARLQAALEQLSLPIVMCLPTLPMPPIWITPGWQESAWELEVRAVLALAVAKIAQRPNVRVVNGSRLNTLSAPATRSDVDWEFLSGFPYKQAHASVLAEMITRLIHPPAPKKGLITDLDNTLWGGILGEDGVDGVSWDLDHKTQTHGLYQRMLNALSSAGVLIAVASKNDPALVEKALERADLVLPRTAVFPIEANWKPKSESVSRILKVWNISQDSVVFIDDSALELAEVSAAHQGMHCIQFPSKAHEVVRMLDQIRDLFGKSAVTEEDTLRLESIRTSPFQAGEDGVGFTDPDQFLQQADAELTVNWSKEPADPRALELINKTNQFNLNGRRFTETSWRNYLGRENTFLLMASYKDKYGALGKIAVASGRFSHARVNVDAWVMSCRAFARRIEHKCLEEMFCRFGVDEIEFDYAATERNGPLSEFLTSILAAEPEPGCCISREQFAERTPETFHNVLEAVNG